MSAYNVGDLGSIPGLGGSPGEGNGNPLQYSCLENPMDRGSLVGYRPWGCKELDMTERLHFHFQRPHFNLITSEKNPPLQTRSQFCNPHVRAPTYEFLGTHLACKSTPTGCCFSTSSCVSGFITNCMSWPCEEGESGASPDFTPTCTARVGLCRGGA